MYFNDVHILYYIAFGIIGLIIGQIIGNFNNKVIHERTKDKKKKDLKEKQSKPHYLIMLATAFIYIILLYALGLDREFINNLELFQYMILTPALISVIVIDTKLKIIPNRLILTLLEIGIVFTFIYGIYDLNVALNRLIAGFVGTAIFLIIMLIGKLISEKEAMGFGDVKFAGVLGIYFGITKIMMLSIMSFAIGAIIGIILLLIKRKKANEYIAFGPFMSLASFILMVMPISDILGTVSNII